MLSKIGALDKSVFNGNTILLKISEENEENRYLYIGGDKIHSFITNDHILNNISNMGNNMIPYSIAIGEENINFPSPHYKHIKRKNIKDVELLRAIGHSVDPFDYHLEKHDPDCFKNLLEFTCIQSS